MTYGFIYTLLGPKNLKTRYWCKMSGFEIPIYRDDCYVWENRFPEFIKHTYVWGVSSYIFVNVN